jgi:molybdenum cofactor biosynthesis protein A
MPIVDQHNRTVNYLRLAVTDRCNLRCSYCMPEQGIKYLHKTALLTYEEMLRVVQILAPEGLAKVRITGGEPFVRQGLMGFLEKLVAVKGINEVAITTNGVLTAPYLPRLKALGISKINLSLDSLDAQTFAKITRRNEHAQVMDCLHQMLALGFDLKINAVVMNGQNDADIAELAAFTKNNAVSVRFIEEMPFNGDTAKGVLPTWDYIKILEELKRHFPNLVKLPDGPNTTAYHYQIPGYKGNIGVIAAYSRTFCGTCNRIRLTPQGELKTCLYEQRGFQLRDLLRSNAGDAEVKAILLNQISKRYLNGHEAENAGNVFSESMSTIGG